MSSLASCLFNLLASGIVCQLLCFMPLTFWKDTGQLFCRMALNLGLLTFSAVWILVTLWYCQEDHRNDDAFPLVIPAYESNWCQASPLFLWSSYFFYGGYRLCKSFPHFIHYFLMAQDHSYSNSIFMMADKR